MRILKYSLFLILFILLVGCVAQPKRYDSMAESKKMSSQETIKPGCTGDCVNGFGTYNFDNGDSYTGYWKNGKRHGKGTYIWSNGQRIDGVWENGTRAK